MQLVKDKLKIKELKDLASSLYGNLVKAVVDINKQILIIDAEMHADLEQEMISTGSRQIDLWGINLYPDNWGKPEFIEYDSMINLRPSQNNHSRSVDDPEIRKSISTLVNSRFE